MPLTEHVWRAAGGEEPPEPLRQGASLTAQKVGAFHWFIEFPGIMDRDKAHRGFDVVIGNPPWERIKLQEQEFFASRSPAIAAAANKAERQKRIDALERADPESADGRLWQDFIFAKRTAEAASEFARSSGRFPLTGRGDVNTYALFTELFSLLAKPSGRAGIIVPTGIATDSSTSLFFGDLVARQRLAQLVDFENRERLFPAVDSRMKFCALSMGPADKASFAFFLTNTAQLDQEERRFTLTPDEIARINPNTKTAPVFRSRADAELTAKIYTRAPVLIEERPESEGGDINPWGITFQAMFHMSGDSGLFRTPVQMDVDGWQREGTDWLRETTTGIERRVPLYEAKMIHHFDHRWATYGGGASDDEEGARDCTLAEKQNPAFEPSPRYWVPEEEVNLRAARVPTALKSALRKGDAGAALKALVTWLAGAIPALEGLPAREADMFRLLGQAQDWRSALKTSPERFLFDPKIQAAGTEMQRETPLAADDLTLIAKGPQDALALADMLITTRQPRWLMGWRDITRATDERTVIASVFPKVGANHKAPLFFMSYSSQICAAFLANIASLSFDYVSRQKIGGTSLTYFYLKQLPVLSPSAFSSDDLAFITPRVLELTYTSHAMKPWAEDLGYVGAPFAWNEDRRAQLRAELDVFFARKYGLNEEEQRYILDPAKVKGADYPSETFRVLKDKETRLYGEYRTERLVLEAWQRAEADQASTMPPSVTLPPLAELPDGRWAWSKTTPHQDRLRYAAQSALWQMDPARDGFHLRFVIAALAEPALLTPWLVSDDQEQWVRLMGSEAALIEDVPHLRPAINGAWRSMYETLITSGQLDERPDGAWIQGPDFNPAGRRVTSADAQRTAFVIHTARNIDMNRLRAVSALEDDVIWERLAYG